MVYLQTFVVVYRTRFHFAFVILGPSVKLISAFCCGEPFKPVRVHIVNLLDVALLFFVQANVFQEIGDLLRSWIDLRVHLIEYAFSRRIFRDILRLCAKPSSLKAEDLSCDSFWIYPNFHFL